MTTPNVKPHLPMATACEVVFQVQFDYMVKSIDTESVSPRCFAAGLINDQQRGECFHESVFCKKAELLFGYISVLSRNQSAMKIMGEKTLIHL